MSTYPKWIACMAHITHDNKEYVDKYIDNRFTDYIISYETASTVGEHIHFVLWAEEESNYHNLCQNVFKKKFSLRGKAIKDVGPRQYGKLKEIEDLKRMMAYTVKDEHVVYKIGEHLSMEDIKQAFDTSFKKEEKLDRYNNLMNHYITNAKAKQKDELFTTRNDLVKAIIENYYEVFEKLPGRQFQINQIYKYERNTGWYMRKCSTFTTFDSQYYHVEL